MYQHASPPYQSIIDERGCLSEVARKFFKGLIPYGNLEDLWCCAFWELNRTGHNREDVGYAECGIRGWMLRDVQV